MTPIAIKITNPIKNRLIVASRLNKAILDTIQSKKLGYAKSQTSFRDNHSRTYAETESMLVKCLSPFVMPINFLDDNQYQKTGITKLKILPYSSIKTSFLFKYRIKENVYELFTVFYFLKGDLLFLNYFSI
jgi:hypothetical protein